MKKIYIGADHGGFELKKEIIEYLEPDYGVMDLGAHEFDKTDDYPDFAKAVARKIAEEDNSAGILICRSGNGMVIAANKIRGAYAALCFSKTHAQKAVEDDNANILCLDSDYESEDSVFEIVQTFIDSEFAGIESRHGRRFKKIQQMEQE